MAEEAEREGAEKEDIVEKLEALRKRVPVEKPKPPEENKRRKKRVRIVGLSVVLIFVIIVGVVSYKFIIQPKAAEKAEMEAAAKGAADEFAQVKSQKLAEIEDAFSGLPSPYNSEKANLIDQVNSAETLADLQAIAVSTPATDGWRTYRISEAEEKVETIKNIGMKVEGISYRGLEDVKAAINQMSYSQLKGAVIQAIETEFIPIRLPRTRAGGGFIEEGDVVNIYYKKETDEGTELITLAKNAKVMAILRAKASGTISMSESELKTETGGGTEGKGTVPSIAIGSLQPITGSYPASAGYKIMQTENTYTVDITEVQKAAAANKITMESFNSSLYKYGVELGNIERETNVGDFDVEFLMLLEVSEDETPEIIKLLSPDTIGDIYLTIVKASWIEEMK